MKTYKDVLWTFVLIITFTSCQYTGKLTRRYKSIEIVRSEKIDTLISVSAYTLEKDKSTAPKPKSVFELSPEGQKEIIRRAGLNESNNSKLFTDLAGDLSIIKNEKAEVIDYTRHEKRINVPLKNLSHLPADRIAKITVRLKFPDDVKLLSCNRLATEYQNIDLGKLNYSNTNSADISANMSTGLTSVDATGGSSGGKETGSSKTTDPEGTTGSEQTRTTSNALTNTSTNANALTGKLSASRSFTEEVLLRQRIVALNASIEDNTLTLYQESISGIDLTGNITADIVFEATGNSNVQRVYFFSKKNGVTLLEAKESLVVSFNENRDLEAELSFDGDFRHVKKNHRTISESDDLIQIIHGSFKPQTAKKVLLVKTDQLNPKLWTINLIEPKQGSSSGDDKGPISITSPTSGGSGELLFSSINEARNFLIWLKLNVGSIVNRVVSTDGHVITLPGNVDLKTPVDKLQIRIP